MSYREFNFKEIEADLLDFILTVRLNRPVASNAITLKMVDELRSVLNDASCDDDVRVVILTGNGKCFSAGGDVKAMKLKSDMFAGTSATLRDNYIRGIQEIPRSIEKFRKPIIAFVNGPAIGAGCDLACMCDIRVASTAAKFGETFSKLALVPGDGGPFFLQRVVGYPKAMEMFLTGELYDAVQALNMNLVNYVFDQDEAFNQTFDLAKKIAANGPIAISMTKQGLKHARSGDMESCLELMAAFQGITQRTNDHFEGVESILAKRSPSFNGS